MVKTKAVHLKLQAPSPLEETFRKLWLFLSKVEEFPNLSKLVLLCKHVRLSFPCVLYRFSAFPCHQITNNPDKVGLLSFDPSPLCIFTLRAVLCGDVVRSSALLISGIKIGQMIKDQALLDVCTMRSRRSVLALSRHA